MKLQTKNRAKATFFKFHFGKPGFRYVDRSLINAVLESFPDCLFTEPTFAKGHWKKDLPSAIYFTLQKRI